MLESSKTDKMSRGPFIHHKITKNNSNFQISNKAERKKKKSKSNFTSLLPTITVVAETEALQCENKSLYHLVEEVFEKKRKKENEKRNPHNKNKIIKKE